MPVHDQLRCAQTAGVRCGGCVRDGRAWLRRLFHDRPQQGFDRRGKRGEVGPVIFPVLPPVGQKVLLCLVAAAIMFGLYYMVVVPGWMPGDKARLRPPWNRVVFLALAAVVVAVTVAILSGMQN